MNDCPRCIGLPDYGIDYSKFQDDGHCKRCGSLDADTFMVRIEAGTVRLDPTDKNYKVYVHNDGGEKFRRSHRIDSIENRTKTAAENAKILRCDHDYNGMLGGRCARCGTTHFEQLQISAADCEDAARHEDGIPLDPMKNWVWATDETNNTKFYFQHLSEPQMKRFVELLNEKKLKLNEPGYFYRKPFFVA